MSAKSKVVTMRDAVAGLVRDGDTVVIEGFTHLICFAAGHEIIRQRRRDLGLSAGGDDGIDPGRGDGGLSPAGAAAHANARLA